MFVQLEELYINVDKIVALGVYEIPKENGLEMGMILNGEKYVVYTVDGKPTAEFQKELQDNMKSILKEIVETAQKDILKITIPVPQLEEFEKEQKKEQIND